MNKIKEAFQPIKADEAMKYDVKEFLLTQSMSGGKTAKEKKKNISMKRSLSIALCCLCILLIGAGGFQYNQVYAENAYVKMAGPVELGVTLNKKEQVIKLEGLNQWGQEVADSVDVSHMSYEEALKAIMESDVYEKYVSGKSRVNISVDSSDQSCKSKLEEQSKAACDGYQEQHRYGQEDGQEDEHGNRKHNKHQHGQE